MTPWKIHQNCNNWHSLIKVFDLPGKVDTNPSTLDFNSAGGEHTVWNVAVIYLREGSNASAPVYDLWYGNVQTLTAMVSNVRRTVHTVHILDASGQARIKWYDNVQNASGGHKQYHGKLAFTLSVIEKEGLNKTVDCAQIVSAVRMVLDEPNDCYLLIASDRKFVEEQQKKITAHNKKLANAKNEGEHQHIGPHQKAIRPNHDSLKQRLFV